MFKYDVRLTLTYLTYCQGQVCFLMHFNGKNFVKLIFFKLFGAKGYVYLNETMTVYKSQRSRLTFKQMSHILDSHQYVSVGNH